MEAKHLTSSPVTSAYLHLNLDFFASATTLLPAVYINLYTVCPRLESIASHTPDQKMSEVAEFIFFQLKTDVKPEDPGNDEGKEVIRIMQSTKHQSGYHSSAWGRAVEDENIVAWVIGSSIKPSDNFN